MNLCLDSFNDYPVVSLTLTCIHWFLIYFNLSKTIITVLKNILDLFLHFVMILLQLLHCLYIGALQITTCLHLIWSVSQRNNDTNHVNKHSSGLFHSNLKKFGINRE